MADTHHMCRARLSGWPSWTRLLSVTLTAAVARLIVFLLMQRYPLTSDPRSYFEQAAELARGSISKPYYWPIGTSLAYVPWIEAFGTSDVVARAVASLYSLMIVPSTMALTATATRSSQLTEISGWIVAVYPPAVLMGADPQSHIIAAVPLCVALICLLNIRTSGAYIWSLLGGLSLGFLSITRPASVLLLFLFAVALFPFSSSSSREQAGVPVPRKRRATGFALLAISWCLVVSPTATHNFRSSSELTLATNDSVNLFLGNNRFTPLYWTSALASGDRSPGFQRYYDTVRAGGNGALRNEAIRYATSNPMESAIRTTNRLRAYWGFDFYRASDLRSIGWTSIAVSIVLLLEISGYIITVCLAIIGLFGPLSSKRSWQRDLLLLCVLLLMLPYVFSFSVGIYHFLSMIALMPIAASGASRFASTGARQSMRILIRSRSFVLCVLVFAGIQMEYAFWLAKYA